MRLMVFFFTDHLLSLLLKKNNNKIKFKDFIELTICSCLKNSIRANWYYLLKFNSIPQTKLEKLNLLI